MLNNIHKCDILLTSAIIIVLVISMINALDLAKAMMFQDIINLSNNSSSAFPINHRVAISGNSMFVVWADIATAAIKTVANDTADNNNQDIFFTRSTDYGYSFGPVINLSNNKGNSNIPQISAIENNVYVVWQDDFTANQEIFFRKSTDNGYSFGPVINLSNNTGDSFNPQVAVSGKNVYVVWQQAAATAHPAPPFDHNTSSENQEIFFTRSTDYGNSFGPVINLSTTEGDSLDPQMTVLAGRGQAEGELEKENEKYNSSSSASKVYLIWTDCISEADSDEPLCDISFTRSTDNGNSFGPVINLSNNTGDSFNPQVAVSGENVYVVWQDDSLTSSGNYDIFFTRSIDAGNSFDSIENISKTGGTSRFQKISTSQNNVYLVWADVNNNSTLQAFDISFTRSTDYGNSFGPVINLSNNTGDSFNPQVAVSEENVYVVWQDDFTANQEIFFRKSADNGNSFANLVDLSNNSGVSTDPTINVISSSFLNIDKTVYIVWQDDTYGTQNIVLKRYHD